MIKTHCILLFCFAAINFCAFSQINYKELTNEKGGIYDYYKGPAYYKDSLYTGSFEEYWTSNDTILWRKGSFLNGLPFGYELYYFENGSPWCIGFVLNRERQGEFVYYRRNGEIQGVEFYKNGILMSERLTITEEPGDNMRK